MKSTFLQGKIADRKAWGVASCLLPTMAGAICFVSSSSYGERIAFDEGGTMKGIRRRCPFVRLNNYLPINRAMTDGAYST